MHFYESSMIITKDGLHCQVYSNEHPEGKIIVKPKYIPTDKISSDVLPSRFLDGKRMNRLNHWVDEKALAEYIQKFSKAYPNYIFRSDVHENSPLFFAVPCECVAKIYSPREGLNQLMNMPNLEMDGHIKKVSDFVSFLLKSGINLENFGITYSTLMGYYSPEMSDINIVVYGKDNFWKLMDFLEKNKHEELRWKNYEEWGEYYTKRNRKIIHDKEIYLRNMLNKKSEGFFRNTLFVIFAVEEPSETWFKWGEESYKQIGNAKFEATVTENKDSVVRPGMYKISNAKFIEGSSLCKELPISKVVFYSRDYCMFAYPGEKIEINGVIEEVTPKTGEKYYRVVVGYFDAYISDRREKECIKLIKINNENEQLIRESAERNESCNLCNETKFSVGENTGYGAVIGKVGNLNDGWFATLSPKTGGDINKDFTIQIMPFIHLTHFSQIDSFSGMAENYGIIFSKVCKAMTEIMIEEGDLKANSEEKDFAVSIGTYGKSTSWKEKKEHLHIKIFPFRGDIGQPYTVDSSFERKEIFKDKEGKEFVIMDPVKKRFLEKSRFDYLINRFIKILN